jgi:hypothetical protein
MSATLALTWAESVEAEARRMAVLRTTNWQRLELAALPRASRVHQSRPATCLADAAPRLRDRNDEIAAVA